MKRSILLIFLLTLVQHSIGQRAIQLFEEGQTLKAENKKVKAINKFEEALVSARNEKLIELEMDCHLELAELKDNLIYYKEALQHYRDFADLYVSQSNKKQTLLKDSVQQLEKEVEAGEEVRIKQSNAIDSLNTAQLKAALEIRDLELDNERKKSIARQAENRKNILILAVLTSACIAGLLGRSYYRKRKTSLALQDKNDEISREKQKSDDLLLNILPKSVAEELKESGKTTSSYFESASVMFADFKGFTKFSEQHQPAALVDIVDYYFSAFDEIVERHGIEKIKTIGDAYLCVSGIPIAKQEHENDILLAAEEMLSFVAASIEEKKVAGLPYLELRIGIHAGPLVAGVVGSKKFAYDVWGDTVNIAARMEQSGEPGTINVSETIYQATKSKFNFEYRGKIAAKNKGELSMYFLKTHSDN